MHLSWKRLQWLRLKRFARQNRGPIAWLAAGLGVVFVFWMTRGSRTCMNWFVQNVSAPWKQFWGGVVDPLPFSAAELLGTLLVLWLIGMTVYTVYEKRVRHRFVVARRIVMLAAVLVWIYAGFCMSWGVHYYTATFAEKSGLGRQPISVEDLTAVTRWFAEGASSAAKQVERDDEGRFLADSDRILGYGDGCYSQIVEEWPFLDGPHRTPKPAFYSKGMSAAAFTGYLFPFLGESTLNVHAPNVYLPVTVAHEMAHQRGVAPEQEANFLGIAACLSCDDAEYQYSGWLFGYSHLSNALHAADQEAWQAIWEDLDERCKKDIEWNDGYWRDFSSPVTSLVQGGYSGFLQSYGQSMGLRSYGACVDLLVAYYRPKIPEKV